jgi:hypothetical protein
MPTFRLSDGAVVTVPDDATPGEVAKIVSSYYGVAGKPAEAPKAPDPVPVAPAPENAPNEAPIASAEAPEAGPDPGPAIVTVVPGIGLEFGEYWREGHIDRDELTERSIEALQKRSGKPDKRHSVFDPPDLHDLDALIRENFRPVKSGRS